MSGTRNEQISLLTDKNGVNIIPTTRGEVGTPSSTLPEKQPYVPVRLTPAWEATNAPEDELNFRNVNMEDAHLQLHPPSDRYNMVYFVLLLHGVGVLMPWNMFITAKARSFGASSMLTLRKLSSSLSTLPEKQPYVPVRLTPAWEATNAPEDELNFRNVNMEDAHLQLHPPSDRYNMVYFVLLLHGVGVLMPWNMFITAKAYFVDYKLSENYTGVSSSYATNFMPYLGFAAQVPNVIFNWVNIFVQLGGNLTTRIVWSITIEVLVFIFTIVLAMSDSHDWPATFFYVTMGCVVILNMANGVYQNTVYGMAAKLPFKYTGVVVLGSNISGTFTAIISILSDSFASNARTAAIYYFITALFVLLLCFDTYFALPLNRFYRHHEMKNLKDAQLKQRENQGVVPKVPYWHVFKTAFPQLFNVFLVFFVTLSVFPEIHSNIKEGDPSFMFAGKFYTSVTCFLTFNVCAMLGSLITSWVTWPKPRYLWIPVTMRLLYIPLFLLCNYQPAKIERLFPVLIHNDYAYWFIAITMGLTSGYFSSLGMIYAPRTVEPQYAATAGMFGAACLITGIFSGILFSFIWPGFVENVPGF